MSYGTTVMNQTQDLAKYLLAIRGENLNISSSTGVDMMYQLDDKDYNGQAASVRDEMYEANNEFDPTLALNSPMAYTTMLTALSGDITNTSQNKIDEFSRTINTNYSSILDYEAESGPLKTFMTSNLIAKDNDFFSDTTIGKLGAKMFMQNLNK
ncbi:hypothetical protein Zmor_009072 [Zophobas morio]|uniref:Uncharacterized protein n=1 Tax=Zophobas morio TaxID=2755281 RepID=A0AA38HI99_9CUCU|nr:hypothetical protein Zmor_009072 [Zophobas morio]